MSAKRLLLTLSVALVVAPAYPATEIDSGADRELDEVTVQSQSELHALRRAMVAAEDQFYSQYNAFNTVPAYEIACKSEAPTGSRLNRRKCLAAYEVEAIREEGFEGFKIRQQVIDLGQKAFMPASPPLPAAVKIEANRPAFQRHIKDTIYRNPELIQLLEDRDAAIARFREARRELYSGKESRDLSGDATPSAQETPTYLE